MVSAASMKLLGAKELDKVLSQFAKTTAQNVSKRAMARALEPVADAARAAAPVGTDGYMDGYLKRSIAVSSKLTKRQAREARAGKSRDVVTMYVGPSAPHAHLVEFGTGPRHKKSTGQFVGAMPPNPFMRAAWDANRNAVLDRLTDDLRAEIDKVLARRARKAAKAGK